MNVLKKFALMFCGSSIGLGAVLGAVFIRSFLVGAGSGDLLMAPLLHDFSNRMRNLEWWFGCDHGCSVAMRVHCA
jgi:hypothetical protein